jgi:WD repeat-containing protein 45
MFGSVLPKYFSSEWSFAQCRLKDAHVICSIKDNNVISVSLEGFYYQTEFDPKTGGECTNMN